jgi:hypothetical protein
MKNEIIYLGYFILIIAIVGVYTAITSNTTAIFILGSIMLFTSGIVIIMLLKKLSKY